MSADNKVTNNVIATVCIVLAVGFMTYVFAASRLDSGLRMAALVAATSTVSALIAIASTILVGKDVQKDTGDTSSITRTTEVKVQSDTQDK